ncbi:hypothetical protein ACG9ZJ_04180 [Acinetobacter sp. ULE_I064]|uniref:hypothetical protein n=1 Tax=Acinetobacter sp. ULE_I064 TaxID=3373071 RepID=UPI003AF588AA
MIGLLRGDGSRPLSVGMRGLQDVPFAQHEQKQSIALYAVRGLASLAKSEASTT